MENTETSKAEKIEFLVPSRDNLKISGKLSYCEGNGSWNLIKLKKEVLMEFPQLMERNCNFSYKMIIPRSIEGIKRVFSEIGESEEKVPILLFLCKEE